MKEVVIPTLRCAKCRQVMVDDERSPDRWCDACAGTPPEPPTTLPGYNDDGPFEFAVKPTCKPYWWVGSRDASDYCWMIGYATEDPRIDEYFHEWSAVWDPKHKRWYPDEN